MAFNKGYIVVVGCKKCGRCRNICPVSALQRTTDDRIKIDHGLCTLCMSCVQCCPNKSLVYME